MAEPWELLHGDGLALQALGRRRSQYPVPGTQGSVWSPGLPFGSPGPWGGAALPSDRRPGFGLEEQFCSKPLKSGRPLDT